MPDLDRGDVLAKLLDAARAASEVVMRVYGAEDIGAELKGPNDPVTRADREANALILARLARDLPGIPVVAEESDPSEYRGFEASRAALFVDPVDGTRDFIERDGEFCVMLGLAEDGRATAGVVLCPVLGQTYVGLEGAGAFLVSDAGERTPIHVSRATDFSDARCAVSRFHRSKSVDARLASLGCKELVPVGSSGIKGVKVASGELDVYAHPSRGLVKLWDACAPDAIARAAGAVYTDATGRPFDYRGAVAQGSGTLAANPTLHAEALRRFAASGAAAGAGTNDAGGSR
jgi:3'(2'), 5'-bisphosphate nucleotidase